MQQIERYGVIALVFLLVTIVAVSFWGDSKSPGFWSRLTGKSDGKKEQTDVAVVTNPLVDDHVVNGSLPLSNPTTPTVLPQATDGALANGNSHSLAEVPLGGTGSIPGTPPAIPTANDALAPNPFMPQAGGTQPVSTTILPIPAPVQSTGSEYVVQKGDSLALIAKRKLGAESRWTEIQSTNPGLDPKRLAPGMTIKLPAAGATVAKAPTAANEPKSAPKVAAKSTPVAKKATVASASKSASSTYTVKKGDLVRSIAKSQLGDENRWKEIVAANPGLDPSKLAIGQKLKMPAGGEARHSSAAPIVASADKPRVK